MRGQPGVPGAGEWEFVDLGGLEYLLNRPGFTASLESGLRARNLA